MAKLLTLPLARVEDANGDVYPGALLYAYLTGTTTPTSTYTTSALSVAHTNPIVADAGGFLPAIFLDPTVTYRFVAKTSAGASISGMDFDPVTAGSAADMQFTQGAGSTVRTVEAKLRDYAVSIKDKGAVADWNGTTGTDNATAIQAALDTGARHVYVPQGKFKFSTPLTLRSGQQLVGDNGALYTASATANDQSLLAFRPATGSKAAIKNAASTDGQGLRGISLDINDATNYAGQFNTTYGTVIEDVRLYGTFDIGFLIHDNYVIDINRLDMTGCTVKRAGILVGSFNALNVRNYHTSITPQAAATCARGLAIYGDGRHVDVDAVMQGWTIGLDIKQAQNVFARLYNENIVCPVKLGDAASSARGVVLQGNWAGPLNTHSQYASRGPIVYLRACNAVRFLPGRWEATPNAASATGPWSILCGASAGNIAIDPQDIFGSTTDRDLVMREAAGASPSIDMTSAYGANGARELILKKDGAFAGTHYGLRIDTAGAVSTSAWAPTDVSGVGSVAALLTGTIPDPASNLL